MTKISKQLIANGRESLEVFFHGMTAPSRAVLQTMTFAMAAAGAAVAFLTLSNRLFAITYLRYATWGPIGFAIGSLVTITVSSLVVGYLLTKFSPEAAGSGIPQVKLAYWKELGFVPWRPVLVKFVAGVLSLGGGTSLGREGPTVFFGGGLASCLSGRMGFPKRSRRLPILIGAAAGLSAAFNAPLAAIAFVMEELIGDLGNRFIGSVVLAAVIGSFVVYAFIGRQPAFSLPQVGDTSWELYLVIPLVAILSAALGALYQRAVIAWRARIRNSSRTTPFLQPVLGGLITWILGCGVFWATGRTGIFGIGYHDLSSALNDGLPWQTAGILVAAKFAATVCCYAWGCCGGIFSPTLFFGGLTGTFVAGILSLWMPLTSADRVVLAAVGMTASLGALVQAPLTSLLIVFEMTHQFLLVPPLMVAVVISQFIARRINSQNFYDALLLQDGQEITRIKPLRDLENWKNLPVSTIANMHPVIITDLSPAPLKEILKQYPYQRFPVMSPDQTSVLTREEANSAALNGTNPRLLKAIVCSPDTKINKVSRLLINEPTGIVLIGDPASGAVSGLVTLHDLVRVQANLND